LRRLLIRQGGSLYRFLQFEFRDGADGSFNLVFDRELHGREGTVWGSAPGSQPRTFDGPIGRFRISYHTTGRVNFHSLEATSIFCEPIFAIREPQHLVTISIPSIDNLTSAPADLEKEAVLELPSDLTGRIIFALSLVPDSFTFDELPLALINYHTWFGLAVWFGELPFAVPPDFVQHVITVFPSQGRYAAQNVAQDQALISFHQKRAGSSDMVYYWEPNTGVYRVVFAVPMRIRPRLQVEFVDPDIRAEEIPPTQRMAETAEIRFRAIGRGGYLRMRQPIAAIELHAEL
jgi:hypothetical protein